MSQKYDWAIFNNYDYALLGMPRAGKTTIRHILCGEELPPKTDQTDIDDVRGIKYVFNKNRILGWREQLLDTGGKDHYYEESADGFLYQKWIRHSSKVLFVFNGMDFIKTELVQPQYAGEISTKMTYYICATYKQLKKNFDTLYFVATHADEYSGSKEDIQNKIIELLQTANAEYSKLTNGQIRYPFAKYFTDIHFFCIDARNKNDVANMYDRINGR